MRKHIFFKDPSIKNMEHSIKFGGLTWSGGLFALQMAANTTHTRAEKIVHQFFLMRKSKEGEPEFDYKELYEIYKDVYSELRTNPKSKKHTVTIKRDAATKTAKELINHLNKTKALCI